MRREIFPMVTVRSVRSEVVILSVGTAVQIGVKQIIGEVQKNRVI